MPENEAGNRTNVVEIEHRNRYSRNWAITRHRDNRAVLGREQRLAGRRPPELPLLMRLALEALDQQQIDRGHMSRQLLWPGLLLMAVFMHQRPAAGGRATHAAPATAG